MLDKLELENRTATRITSKERIETRLWNAIALREAVINAIIHNDYTREVPPKFEIFSDRLEITSYGGLFEGMTEQDLFEGLSLPRNKEIMRIYKDLDMVEQLGSGVPRILQSYQHDCFVFSDNFVRMVFPRTVVEADQVIPQDKHKVTSYITNDSDQVSDQVKALLETMSGREISASDLMSKLGLSHRPAFRKNYLHPALKAELIEMTNPNKPKSRSQKYRLTGKGNDYKKGLL